MTLENAPTIIFSVLAALLLFNIYCGARMSPRQDRGETRERGGSSEPSSASRSSSPPSPSSAPPAAAQTAPPRRNR